MHTGGLAADFGKASSYIEREQIYVLLGEFIESTRDIIPKTPVPSFVGIFTSRALLILQNPVHFLYGKINRFLNKGPPWKLAKIPSYWIDKILLNQPDDDDAHRDEVKWLLDTMIDGLRSKEVSSATLTEQQNVAESGSQSLGYGNIPTLWCLRALPLTLLIAIPVGTPSENDHTINFPGYLR